MNILLLLIALLQPCDLSDWQTIMDTYTDALTVYYTTTDATVDDLITYQFAAYNTLDELADLELDTCGADVQRQSIKLINAYNRSAFAGLANVFADNPVDIAELEAANEEQLAALNEALETVGWEAFVLPESPE